MPRTGEPNTVVERLEVTQGKLNFGLRSTITYADDAYPAALLFNGVLGGYPHSKLFIHVRKRTVSHTMHRRGWMAIKGFAPFNRVLNSRITKKQNRSFWSRSKR